MRTLARAVSRLGPRFWIPADAVVSGASVLAAHALSSVYQGDPLGESPRLVAVVAALAVVLAAHAVGLYDAEVIARRGLVLRRTLAAGIAGIALTLLAFYAVPYRPIGRRVAAVSAVLAVAGLAGPRLLAWSVLRLRPRRVLFAADSPLARQADVTLTDLADLQWIDDPMDDGPWPAFFRRRCAEAGFLPTVSFWTGSWEFATSLVRSIRASRAARAIVRYMAPVSRNSKSSRSARALARLLLPTPAGPSSVTIMGDFS